MANLSNIINILDSRFTTQTSFLEDNIGLLLGDKNQKIDAIMCCIDVDQQVIKQAISAHANLIVSHHPLIFTPFKAVTSDSPFFYNLKTLFNHDINVYSAHTNLDFCYDGINDYCAKILNIQNAKNLDKIVGRYGKINPIPLDKLVQKCQTLFNCSVKSSLKNNNPPPLIKSVAIINGAGGGNVEYIDLCVKFGIDCLLTAEIKHHVALYASELGINLIELSHFASEYCFLPQLKQIISHELEKNEIFLPVHTAKQISPIN